MSPRVRVGGFRVLSPHACGAGVTQRPWGWQRRVPPRVPPAWPGPLSSAFLRPRFHFPTFSTSTSSAAIFQKEPAAYEAVT